MINFQQEKILITGGTKGPGQAVVNELIAHDAKVTVLARNKIVADEEVDGVTFYCRQCYDVAYGINCNGLT